MRLTALAVDLRWHCGHLLKYGDRLAIEPLRVVRLGGTPARLEIAVAGVGRLSLLPALLFRCLAAGPRPALLACTVGEAVVLEAAFLLGEGCLLGLLHVVLMLDPLDEVLVCRRLQPNRHLRGEDVLELDVLLGAVDIWYVEWRQRRLDREVAEGAAEARRVLLRLGLDDVVAGRVLPGQLLALLNPWRTDLLLLLLRPALPRLLLSPDLLADDLAVHEEEVVLHEDPVVLALDVHQGLVVVSELLEALRRLLGERQGRLVLVLLLPLGGLHADIDQQRVDEEVGLALGARHTRLSPAWLQVDVDVLDRDRLVGLVLTVL